jgi:glycosyltransferase involved in cell wall biosynthesis
VVTFLGILRRERTAPISPEKPNRFFRGNTSSTAEIIEGSNSSSENSTQYCENSMSAPLVSIGLPVYNGEAYLEGCLNAILGQTFEDFEVVISDNASTDNTGEICRRLMQNDKRIRYVRQSENLGAAQNYNIVFEMSCGKFFRWAAHDDLIMPSYLEKCVQVLEKDTNMDIVIAYPRAMHFDERTKLSELYDVELPWGGVSASSRLADCLVDAPATILTKCYPVFGLMRRDVLQTTRLIQPFNSSDKVLLVEMALRGNFQEIPEYLFHRRLHDGTSLNVSASYEDVARWFDPKQGKRFPMPQTKLLLGYLRATWEAPLKLRSKWKCFRTISRMCMRKKNWRIMLGECRIRIMQDLGLRKRVPSLMMIEEKINR